MISDTRFTALFIMPGTDLYAIPDDYERRFAADGIRLVRAEPTIPLTELVALAPEADAVLMASGRYPAGDVFFDALPRCRLILRMGAGYDNVDVAAATRHGVLASNMPGSNHEDVSDHAIGLLLACARRIALLDRSLRTGAWDAILAAPIRRLRGQTLGFVGFGRIARVVAEKLSGFGLSYLASDPLIEAPVVIAGRVVQPVGFGELLARSDIVSLHTPATPQTFRLMNRSAFAQMRPGAILVNTARGSVIDESALIEALEQGRLAAAGLDVFDPEPPAANNPLLRFPNVILTPHVAGYSLEGLHEFVDLGHRLISDFLLLGQPPQWTLNSEVAASR